MSDIVPVVIDRLKYSLNEEAGLACVDGYDGQPKNVTIPSAIVINEKNTALIRLEPRRSAIALPSLP